MNVPKKIRPQVIYPPIEAQMNSHVGTDCASFYLARRPQTLRIWASAENGPIRPIRINKRLAWSVAEIKQLLGK